MVLGPVVDEPAHPVYGWFKHTTSQIAKSQVVSVDITKSESSIRGREAGRGEEIHLLVLPDDRVGGR